MSVKARSRTREEIEARTKIIRSLLAAEAQKYAELVESHITPDVVERWRNSSDKHHLRLSRSVDDFRNGKITEAHLSVAIGDNGNMAYHEGVKELQKAAVEKVRLDNLQAISDFNASIRAQQDALILSIDPKALGRGYDVRNENTEDLPSPGEIASRQAEVNAKLERLKLDLPIYSKFTEIYYDEEGLMD